MKFINRKKELKAIKEKLDGPGLDFYVIYGRRRIGKTTLSLACVKGKEFVYYLATEENNLKKLKEVASRVEPRIKYVEEDLEAIFNFLKDKIIIIDEFPNLIKENPKGNHSPLGSPHLTTRHSGGWIELRPDHFDKSLSFLLRGLVGA